MTETRKPSALKSFLSGAGGGFCLVRMQTSASGMYTSTLQAASQIVRKDGMRGLYRGVSPVLAGAPVYSLIQPILALNFLAYFHGQQLVHSFYCESNHTEPVPLSRLSLVEVGLAGALSSLPSSFLVGPAEQIKIRMQIQDTSMKNKGSGAFHVARTIIKDHGVRALFRGTGMTMLRDVPTGFAYFCTYEGLKRKLQDENGQPMAAVMLAGGIAGMVNWTLAIPIDTIKSRIQSASGKMIGTVVADLMNEGPRAFFKGLGPTLLRAFPASSAFFFGVELTTSALDRILV